MNSINNKITLIGSIHRFINVNKNYTISDLFNAIKERKPELLAIEINPEDICTDIENIETNYAPEFARIIEKFSSSIEIVGFNWQPEIFWKNRQVYKNKQMESQKNLMSFCNEDELREFGKISDDIRNTIISGNIIEVNSKEFDELLYKRKNILLSIYNSSARDDSIILGGDMHTERIKMIHENLLDTLNSHSDKATVIVTGAMHRSHLVDFLKENFNKRDLELYL